MENLRKTLRKKTVGCGKHVISIMKDCQAMATVTYNNIAVEAAFDEFYNEIVDYTFFYESRKEAQIALVNEILKAYKNQKVIKNMDVNTRVAKKVKEYGYYTGVVTKTKGNKRLVFFKVKKISRWCKVDNLIELV